MKHWDLFPGETVTLASRGQKIVARFEFRDTAIAAFFDDCEGPSGELRVFALRDDGDLEQRASREEIVGMLSEYDYNSADAARWAREHRRHWLIEGAERHTRHLV